MKYFTPELLLRVRSADEAIAEAANEELDTARAAYWKRIGRIKKRLQSAGADQIEDRFTLHDARLLGVEVSQKKPLVVLKLQLEGFGEKPGPVLEIKYRTVPNVRGAFVLRRHPELDEGTSRRFVLYDEFDGTDKYLTHSLLLNGLEIMIRFSTLEVRLPREPVYPIEDVTQPLELSWGGA